ncbi:MAG: 4Fe-4S binding protein [Chloroflexi bacterium]|nr:4Fe-4S binding protein [Chloroflexota bacterium]
MTFRVDLGPCINCGLCRLVCPTEAVKYYTTGRRTHVIDDDWCIDCALCAHICPVDCIDHLPQIQPAPEQLELAKAKARTFAKQQREKQRTIDDRAAAFLASKPAVS